MQEVGSSSYVGRHSLQMFEEGRSFSGNERFCLFLGGGDGSFQELSALGGADSNLDGRALVACDFDDDGDTDLFVHAMQRERHLLFRNDLGGAFVKLRLRATRGQYEAIGATVVVDAGRPVAQVLSRGAGFESCQAPELVFGLGQASEARVEVRWPGGAREDFGSLAAGARALLVEGTGAPQSFEARTRPLPDPLPDGLRVRIGEALPELTLLDAAGQPARFRATETEGPLLVNFWATYCAPCVGELPALARIDAAGERRVVLFSVDAPGDRERGAALLAERAPGVEAYYLAEGGRGLDGWVDLLRLPIPTSLEVDAQGVVSGVVRGVVEEQ